GGMAGEGGARPSGLRADAIAPVLTPASSWSRTWTPAPTAAVKKMNQFSSESAERMTSSTYTPMVKPATPLALGLVGNVAHWRKNTIGMSTNATARLATRATRSTRRLITYTATVIVQ